MAFPALFLSLAAAALTTVLIGSGQSLGFWSLVGVWMLAGHSCFWLFLLVGLLRGRNVTQNRPEPAADPTEII